MKRLMIKACVICGTVLPGYTHFVMSHGHHWGHPLF
jgi:hypothetical protein